MDKKLNFYERLEQGHLYYSKKLQKKHRTHWLRKLPEFIIAGVQKCGTTSLYNYLNQHPQIQFALKKEVKYFDMHYEKPLSWYRAHFPVYRPFSRQKVVVGEATPDYILFPEIGKEISQLNRKIKLILLLRDPVKRLISQYKYSYRRGFEDLKFKDAMEAETERLNKIPKDRSITKNIIYRENSYYKRSMYYAQVSDWLKYFNLDQFYFLDLDELTQSPNVELNKVCQFLGVSAHDHYNISQKFNSSPSEQTIEIHPEDILRLRQEFHAHNEAFFQLIGKRFDWPAS